MQLACQRCCMRGALQHRFQPGLIKRHNIMPQIYCIVFKLGQHRRHKSVASANRVDKAAHRMRCALRRSRCAACFCAITSHGQHNQRITGDCRQMVKRVFQRRIIGHETLDSTSTICSERPKSTFSSLPKAYSRMELTKSVHLCYIFQLEFRATQSNIIK